MSGNQKIYDGDWVYEPCGKGPQGETLYVKSAARIRPYPYLVPLTQAEIDEMVRPS